MYVMLLFFFFKQKTAYEMRISDWSSDVCSSDLPGATLTDLGRRYRARVRADGSVQMDDREGSIHQIGAAAQGAPSCNGWTFWHVDDGKTLVCLDSLRDVFRSGLDA